MTLLDTVRWYLDIILQFGIQMVPCMSMGVAAYLLLRPIRMERLAAQGLRSGPAHELGLLLFIMFCSGLASLTLFPADFWSWPHWEGAFRGRWPLFPPVDWQLQLETLQLTPFEEIRRAVHGPWVMFMMVANIGIFLPIGFCPALLWRDWRWWKSFLAGISTSATIEFVQFFIGRSTDIDDIILNTTGALAGFWLFWLLHAICPHFFAKFQCRSIGEG